MSRRGTSCSTNERHVHSVPRLFATIRVVDDHLSTEEVGWVLGRSAGTVREMIEAGDIEASRIPAGYRIGKAEVLRLARERIEAEAGKKLSDRALERLVDEVIETNRRS
jgi:excisionase family DNA binding protein